MVFVWSAMVRSISKWVATEVVLESTHQSALDVIKKEYLFEKVYSNANA